MLSPYKINIKPNCLCGTQMIDNNNMRGQWTTDLRNNNNLYSLYLATDVSINY